MNQPTESYEYVRAIVEDGTTLLLKYRLVGGVEGRMQHDEDVEGWTEQEIINLACNLLEITQAERKVIKVEYR